MKLVFIKAFCSPFPSCLLCSNEAVVPDGLFFFSLGVGKTTLIQKATEVLKSSGVPVDGFYTEEVRQGGRRIGFDVVTLSGIRGPLSRIGYCSFILEVFFLFFSFFFFEHASRHAGS